MIIFEKVLADMREYLNEEAEVSAFIENDELCLQWTRADRSLKRCIPLTRVAYGRTATGILRFECEKGAEKFNDA